MKFFSRWTPEMTKEPALSTLAVTRRFEVFFSSSNSAGSAASV
jgi:hypothetical protein